MTTPVAVNLTWCVPGDVGGSEHYLVRQLLGLAELEHEFDATIYAPPGLADAHPELAARYPFVTLPVSGRSRPGRVLLEHTWLWERARRAALVHHGGGTVPALGHHPVVLTVHDLQFLEYPQYFSRLKAEYLRRRMPRSVRRAEVLTVPSDFVRGTVARAYGVSTDRIVVVPHGVEPTLGLRPTPAGELRAKYDLGDGPVLVLPAATFPHKGHGFLLELLQTVWTDPALRLVLIGGRGLAEDTVAADIVTRGVGDRVRRPGWVPPEDRDGLIQLADALVFPTEYEGFGAPLIEAMTLGTPIIASDRAAVPEVLGDAGLSLPLNVGAWAGALEQVRRDRVSMVARGRERSAHFTNRISGEALLVAYRRVRP